MSLGRPPCWVCSVLSPPPAVALSPLIHGGVSLSALNAAPFTSVPR